MQDNSTYALNSTCICSHSLPSMHTPCLSCRFQQDQVFSDAVETQIRAVSLVDGTWYIRLEGDLAGKVVGAVYDASAGESDLVAMPLSVSGRLWCLGDTYAVFRHELVSKCMCTLWGCCHRMLGYLQLTGDSFAGVTVND